MFGTTQSVVLQLDVDGKATGVVSSTTENLLAGVIGHVTSHLTSDTVVIGMGRTVGAAALMYGTAVFINSKLTGQLRFNPLAA
jgi:hypothetical protein